MDPGRCELLCLDLEVAERLRTISPSAEELGSAAERGRALADPTRLALAAALAGADELCVCDLAWIVERSQSLVSHHLRVLRTAGLAGSRRERRMVMYALTERGRTLVDALLEQEAAVS